MASTEAGAEAVVHCLGEINGFALIEQDLSAEKPREADSETERVQWRKDRDNIVVLVQELLRNKVSWLNLGFSQLFIELSGTDECLLNSPSRFVIPGNLACRS
jgi:hypothetical protein